MTDLQKAWFRSDTVGSWRMMRPYNALSAFIKAKPETKWLTIGDGRFGIDGITLNRIEPSLNVLPTDICTDQLEFAKNEKWIKDYSKVNAEKIDFGNNSFDYVLCKEAYHHFPRPFIALYEMLRVAKEAIILIEPNDKKDAPLPHQLLTQIKSFLKKMIGRKNLPLDTWNFEEIGNYIYSISKREMEKLVLGLNLPALAYFYYNDYYEKGVEFAEAPTSPLYKKVTHIIKKADRNSQLGLKVYGNIIVVIFKKSPSTEEVKLLKQNGFRFADLPKNPYLP